MMFTVIVDDEEMFDEADAQGATPEVVIERALEATRHLSSAEVQRVA